VSIAILLAGAAVMLAWMTLPIPNQVGRFLLLDRVPGIRMLWGFELKQPGVVGAALNGLGVPAINHVLMAPRLEFFRPFFADLSAQEFNAIFNRYAHIMPEDVPAPFSPQLDVIVVPVNRFDVPVVRLPPEP
jgi:hypothetical protein